MLLSDRSTLVVMMRDDLRSVRQRQGYTLRELAALAGTSAATLHAYEHGHKWPGWPTFERIVRAAGFQPVIELVRAPGPASYPVAALVDDIRGAVDADRLRLVVEFVDRWNETADDCRTALVHDDPGQCGDRRWDALVGGLVEHLAWHSGLRAPGWVGDASRFLETRWWPVDLPIVRIWAMSSASASLARRGVMLSREDLERV